MATPIAQQLAAAAERLAQRAEEAIRDHNPEAAAAYLAAAQEFRQHAERHAERHSAPEEPSAPQPR